MITAGSIVRKWKLQHSTWALPRHGHPSKFSIRARRRPVRDLQSDQQWVKGSQIRRDQSVMVSPAGPQAVSPPPLCGSPSIVTTNAFLQQLVQCQPDHNPFLTRYGPKHNAHVHFTQLFFILISKLRNVDRERLQISAKCHRKWSTITLPLFVILEHVEDVSAVWISPIASVYGPDNTISYTGKQMEGAVFPNPQTFLHTVTRMNDKIWNGCNHH